MLPFKLRAMKWKQGFINQLLAEVLVGKGEEDLEENLKQLKGVGLAVIAFVQNAAIKFPTSAAFLVRSFCAQNVELT